MGIFREKYLKKISRSISYVHVIERDYFFSFLQLQQKFLWDAKIKNTTLQDDNERR